ncbi:ATP-dependent RecD-like DNA helicase [Salisediminibacterium halotolerans]|uniref:ATP-dependent RecD2 DNA helicase n=1 Tax=Salisediminibacterium halotolerans TaxID=517425 RepID=A0A1H9VAS2_9BACI|nr:ATP-dependent RecD-like DNA helicase [Salisediminibacterium haloalkalitolerans]SES18631.1 exodeoxyribonuclease V alpha subunit [Salisediminibacterium haloalkalitolerans]
MTNHTETEQEYIKGELLHLIYHAADSLYTVAKIRVHEASLNPGDPDVTVVGAMSAPESDVTYRFDGQFTEHPRFGRQFKFSTYETVMPETKQGIVLYLSSDRFEGIGKKTAEAVVDHLGEEAISKILADRKVLDDIPNVKKEKAAKIYAQLIEDQGIEAVLTKLYQYGFGVQLALKVFQTYQMEALHMIENNPYQMVEDVDGVGFQRADAIGRKQGLTSSDPERLRAGIMYVLTEETISEGHTYAATDKAVEKAVQLLESDVPETIDPQAVADQALQLAEEDKLMIENGRMYVHSLYFAEKGITSHMDRLINQLHQLDTFPEAEFYKALGETEDELGITYAPSQREAIYKALHSPMMILTGGPGTGKTTVIQGVIHVYSKLHSISIDPDDYTDEDAVFPVLMAAPTGRAAKRMTESTGLPASTIHRMLGYKGESDGYFERNEETPLEGSVLIVDEMSMVDTWLCNQLLKAVPMKMQLLFVGDEDQLPSVGPGQVLADMIDSGAVPAVPLTDIYRQAEDSEIISFSHEVKTGQLPNTIRPNNSDLRFLPCGPEQVPDAVKRICEGARAKGYSARDIQVLAPMYRGTAGVNNLNSMLQELFNPEAKGRREVPFGDVVYRTGDMVLQLVNNPESNVFNGDRGEIVAIFKENETTEKQLTVVVSFDGEEVSYKKTDLTQITHAYCCSIHKSQGSEFPIVIMPVVWSYARMLRKKLIYTGITRAKSFLLLCGEWSSLDKAVTGGRDIVRNTTLKERLKGIVNNEAED